MSNLLTKSMIALSLVLGACASSTTVFPPDANPNSNADAATATRPDANVEKVAPDAAIFDAAIFDAAIFDADTTDAQIVTGTDPVEVTDGLNVSITGDTTGAATWVRPLAAAACPATDFSVVGTDVEFLTHVLSNSTGGSLSVSATTSAAHDSYLVVYTGNMVPADTLACLVGNDDITIGSNENATVTFVLAAGTDATVVVTGFDNDDQGPYSLIITANTP